MFGRRNIPEPEPVASRISEVEALAHFEGLIEELKQVTADSEKIIRELRLTIAEWNRTIERAREVQRRPIVRNAR